MRLPLGAFFLSDFPFHPAITQFVQRIKLQVRKGADDEIVLYPVVIARLSLSGFEQPRQHSAVAKAGLGGWFERGESLSRGGPSIGPRMLHSLEVIVI
jgi:hypothetical protein